MFTGIVTALGTIRSIAPLGDGDDMRLVIAAPWPDTAAIAIGASIGCSGCCLTAVEIGPDWFAADASAETLGKTTLGRWKVGTRINLERSLRLGDELGGHLVSGHVDGVGEAVSAVPENGSTRWRFRVPAALARFIAVKGSVAVDGVSLTVNEVTDDTFGVNIIPHTAAVTGFGLLRPGRRGEYRDRHAGALRRSAGGVQVMHDIKTVELSQYLSSAEELIEEARNGRMFILVDDEDRENEGDLVVPAQFATPDAINFMARHARGLICLALTRQRVEQLGLPLMSAQNGTRHQTAFTISIEAREGVTTGISAHDRARTVAVAINPECGRDDIVTPGHIFPLMAREGGTLVRAGHTEASVDIARKAGLYPAAVICEIMNDDGTMARLPDLVSFAQHHNLKLGSIADLIAYRRLTERLVKRVAEGTFQHVAGGDWRAVVYANTVEYQEHLALVKGDLSGPEPVMVRMHAVDLLDDMTGGPHWIAVHNAMH